MLNATSPFYRATAAASQTSSDGRRRSEEFIAQDPSLSGEVPYFGPRPSQTSSAANQSRMAADQFLQMEMGERGQFRHDWHSYEARQSVDMMPVPPASRDRRRHSDDQGRRSREMRRSYEETAALARTHSNSAPSGSSESDKAGALRARSRAELEQFRRQAMRQRAGQANDQRAESAPGGLGELEDVSGMPRPRPSSHDSGHVNVQVIVQRDRSQSLEQPSSEMEPRRGMTRQDTIARASTFLHHITPDTDSRGFRAVALAVKVLLWVVTCGGAVWVAIKVFKNSTDISSNHNQIVGLISGPPPPPM